MIQVWCSLFNRFIFVSSFTYNLIIVLYSNDLLSVCLLIFCYIFYAIIYYSSCYTILLFILFLIYDHFWQSIFLHRTLDFRKNYFSFPILIFGEFPILWVLVKGSATLQPGKLSVRRLFSSPSSHAASPILHFEWSIIIFRWHGKLKGINKCKWLEITGIYQGDWIYDQFIFLCTSNKK